MKKLVLVANLLLLFFSCGLLLANSGQPSVEAAERTRVYTRGLEFDYVTWALDAMLLKTSQSALDAPRYLSLSSQRKLVAEYLKVVQQSNRLADEIEQIYSNPDITDKAQAAAEQLAQEQVLKERLHHLAPLCESVLQQQLGTVLKEYDLTFLGQPVPPPLYHITPLPQALIVSSREVIRQEADISLNADLSLDKVTELEEQVQKGMNASALVVPIGGVGIYPTMVMSTTDLTWLSETIAHEWIHNYLTLRPLGLNYETTPQLRIMNETTASLAGKEIGEELLRLYYPELLPQPPPNAIERHAGISHITSFTTLKPALDFRKEMHETRVKADQLLAEGKIDEAESYMEERRQFLWENGYQIRKINQAYFAFYGAYADVPGGAAGKDPVGPAVRELRKQSGSLKEFLDRISWFTSFEQLQKAVEEGH